MTAEQQPAEKVATPRGIYCPSCRGVRLTVTYTRSPCAGRKVRYRRCAECRHRFTTTETIDPPRRSKGAGAVSPPRRPT